MLNPTPSATVHIPAAASANTLQAGHTYPGVIRAYPDGLAAHIGRIQIPLEADAGLTAGQRVEVRVQAQGDTLQLTIRPQAAAAGAQSAAAASAAAAQSTAPSASALGAVLRALGRPDLLDTLPGLLPRNVPRTEATLRAAVSTLLAHRSAGSDVLQLQQILGQATSEGVLPQNAGASLSPWLSLTALADTAAWENLVRRARSERTAVLRLARLVSGNGAAGAVENLHDTLASLARRLLDSEAFRNWLRGTGQDDAFRGMADRILERAAGGDAQNLRGLGQPYQFLELPLSAQQGFHRIQLHFFGDGGAGSREGDKNRHRTVLDVETTRLGPLWIDIQNTGRACVCHFKLQRPEVVEAIEAGTPELADSLSALGYDPVRVTVAEWDGDREEALTSLLAPFQPLDLEA